MEYDVIVLGGGPGGYLAAERAGQAGLKTLLVEARSLGGTCLNEGCVPTKTLLYSGKLFDHAKNGTPFGVTAENVSIDHAPVIGRKDKVVKQLVRGVEMTEKMSGVEVLRAEGRIAGKDGDAILVEAGGETHTAKDLILATGSVCTVLPIPGLEAGLSSGFVVTNREILGMKELPERLVVLGGGVIGLELASYFSRIGVGTTVIEMLDHIGGRSDIDCMKLLQRNCERKGIRFLLNSKVTEIKDGSVVFEKDGETQEIPAGRVLLSIGRRANTEGTGIETAGVLTERGAVVTDSRMQTNVPHIYAVGDVNGKVMLAHTAYREAEVAVNTILGRADEMRYDTIPSVIYTSPEFASVGETEESAAAAGYDVKTVKIPMGYSGRYMAENERGDGIAKLVFDRKTDRLIGAQALADYSSEFIVAAGIMVDLGLTADRIRKLVFPHPTVAEILREGAWQY